MSHFSRRKNLSTAGNPTIQNNVLSVYATNAIWTETGVLNTLLLSSHSVGLNFISTARRLRSLGADLRFTKYFDNIIYG